MVHAYCLLSNLIKPPLISPENGMKCMFWWLLSFQNTERESEETCGLGNNFMGLEIAT